MALATEPAPREPTALAPMMSSEARNFRIPSLYLSYHDYTESVLATALADLATFVAALATLVVAITGLRNQAKIRSDVEKVHTEVTTANGLTLAALADNQETRRIKQIDDDKRTAGEDEHMIVLTENPPETGPPSKIDP